MEDIAQKVNDFLSSPDAFAKIQETLNALNLGGKVEESPTNNNSGGEQKNDGFDISSLLSQVNLEDLGGLKNLISSFSGEENDKKVALLLALKPYLSDKRIDKVDMAIKLLKFSKLTPLLKDLL